MVHLGELSKDGCIYCGRSHLGIKLPDCPPTKGDNMSQYDHAHYTNGTNTTVNTPQVKSKSATTTEIFDEKGNLTQRTVEEYVEYVEPKQVTLSQPQYWMPTVGNPANTQ